MLNIVKNDWLRMKVQRNYLCVAVALTVCSVIMAVTLTNKLGSQMNLAVVGGESYMPAQTAQIKVTNLEKEPELSQLVQGEYDGAVIFDEDGGYRIETAKPEHFRKELETMLTGQMAVQKSKGGDERFGGKTQMAQSGETFASETPLNQSARGVGTNILGYMLMFLLMQGVIYGRLFAEDKEKHQIERIVCSPINFGSYLWGHVLFIMGLVFLPAAGMLTVLALAGVNLGLALWQLLLLVALAAFMSTCFSVCINAFFRSVDTANMIGSCVVVLTSVLSGTFFDMGGIDGWLKKLIYVLPQKNLMVFVDAWEKNLNDRGTLTGLFYVILCAGVFLCIGIIKTRKDYVYHRSRQSW